MAARRLDDWAMSSGSSCFSRALFVFHRTLCLRHADSYSDVCGTKDMDDHEVRRFGEASGSTDN